MLKGKWGYVVLGAAVLLSGCSGFWDPPASSGSGSGTNTASGVFYLLDSRTTQLLTYSITSSTTAPTQLSNSPIGLGAAPLAMAVSPTGSFLYVSTGAPGIFLYTIASDGTLTAGNNSQAISQDPATSMVVDPTGQWLIEASSLLGTVNAIPLVTSTGLYNSSLQVQTAQLSAGTLTQLTMAPSGAYVFASLGTGGTEMIPFTASQASPFGSNGTLIPLANPTKSTAASALSVAVDPTSRLLYIGETQALSSGTQTGGLRVFPITATGLGTEVTGSPYATGGTGPAAILPDLSGAYVYAGNKAVSSQTASTIASFAITVTGSVYSLSSLGSVAAGTTPIAMAEDSSKTYILLVNEGGSPDLNTYTIGTNGALTAATTLTSGNNPVAITALP